MFMLLMMCVSAALAMKVQTVNSCTCIHYGTTFTFSHSTLVVQKAAV